MVFALPFNLTPRSLAINECRCCTLYPPTFSILNNTKPHQYNLIGSGEGFARTFPIVCLITIMTLSQVKSCDKDMALNNSFYISLKIIILTFK